MTARDATQPISEQAADQPRHSLALVTDAAHTGPTRRVRRPRRRWLDVFASVLGVDAVGVHDNFFTVGGDSILALVARSKAEKRGIAFDIEELFARPTVAELAESSFAAGAGAGKASRTPSRCFR